MAKPTYDELLDGSTRWIKDVGSLKIRLNFHGYKEPDYAFQREGHPGTWCWYLLVPEQMYLHRWADFQIPQRDEKGYWNYMSYDPEEGNPIRPFADVPFHGGVTWYDRKVSHYCRTLKRDVEVVEIGCDYNHYWDSERGYPDTYSSVLADATQAAEVFMAENPDFQIRSGWSGRWAPKEVMIKCRHGGWKHPEDAIPEDYELWQAAELADAE